jgi:PKD repeat protein
VNASGGDFHELASSATVGTGVTDPTNDESLDFDGLVRSLSGLTDMGAFEYQTLGATAGASASSVQVGTPVTFTGAATGPNAGAAALTYSWTFDDGTSASGQVVSHTFNTAGTHTGTFTVGLVDGSSLSATAGVSLGVTAPPTSTPTPTPQPGVASAGTPTVRGTTATVPITCTGATACDVTLTLSEGETLKGGKVVSVAKVKTTHRTIVVGSAVAAVAAGKTASATITLSAGGTSLLAKYKTIHPTLTVTQGSVSVAHDTVTFVKHKHKHKHKKH